MRLRVKGLVGGVIAAAVISLVLIPGHPSGSWVRFVVYLAAVLLSSGMKVQMPKGDGSITVNCLFILLGIVEFSPFQLLLLALTGAIAQSRFGESFRFIPILFNAANSTTSTLLAWFSYYGALRLLNHEVAPALAVAATLYFLISTIPVALILAWESQSAPLKRWLQEAPWSYSFYLAGAIVAAAARLIALRYGWLTSLLLIPMVYAVYRAYRAQLAAMRDRDQRVRETEALHLRTIEGLAMAIEAKEDQNNYRHLVRVRVYASEIGRIMGLDEPMQRALLFAASLHDIGKLAVPEHIINKPGRLTPEEFEKMKLHTIVGAEILRQVQFPFPVVPIVRSHHESWDGSGYPDGLQGEQIPIGARILTAVDCLDALTSDRPFRRAMTMPEAMVVMKEKVGSQFDPRVVDLLEENYPRLEELADKQIQTAPLPYTNRIIERGAAPAAGFEPQHEAGPAKATEPVDEEAKSIVENPRQSAQRAIDLAYEMLDRTLRLNGAATSSELFAMISKILQTVIPFDCFAASLKSGNCLQLHYLEGPCAGAFSWDPIPMGEGLSGWVAECERPIVNGNPTVESNFRFDAGLLTSNSSALSVPLFDSSGAVAGVFTLYAQKYAAFSKHHLQILQAFSVAMQKAIPPRRAEIGMVIQPETAKDVSRQDEAPAQHDAEMESPQALLK